MGGGHRALIIQQLYARFLLAVVGLLQLDVEIASELCRFLRCSSGSGVGQVEVIVFGTWALHGAFELM